MEETLNRLFELKKIRDEATAGIEAILGGATVEKRTRAPQRCSQCQEEGHTARTCPSKLPEIAM